MRRPRPRDRGRQPRSARASASRPAAAAGSAPITPLAMWERYLSSRVIDAPASATAPVGQGTLVLSPRGGADAAAGLPDVLPLRQVTKPAKDRCQDQGGYTGSPLGVVTGIERQRRRPIGVFADPWGV